MRARGGPPPYLCSSFGYLKWQRSRESHLPGNKIFPHFLGQDFVVLSFAKLFPDGLLGFRPNEMIVDDLTGSWALFSLVIVIVNIFLPSCHPFCGYNVVGFIFSNFHALPICLSYQSLLFKRSALLVDASATNDLD